MVSAIPVMPLILTAWRTPTASNQPQRRGLPVVAPNSAAFAPESLAFRPLELGRERTAADSRRVGFREADDLLDAARADARRREHAADDRTGRRDVRIRAVIDVEEASRVLRAFE